MGRVCSVNMGEQEYIYFNRGKPRREETIRKTKTYVGG
jgi:hypothetical protein